MDEKNIEELYPQLVSQWERITISNDFAFSKIMQDKELFAELLRRVHPDVKFDELRIQAQKDVSIGTDIHGVRFDIFANASDNRTATIEMQVANIELAKRIRFYNSMADIQMLEKGVPYTRLGNAYIVVICPFDPIGEGFHRYTFTRRCRELHDLELEDGVNVTFLNAIGRADDVDDKLKAFLNYVAGIESDDEYIQKLMKAVQKARLNKE